MADFTQTFIQECPRVMDSMTLISYTRTHTYHTHTHTPHTHIHHIHTHTHTPPHTHTTHTYTPYTYTHIHPIHTPYTHIPHTHTQTHTPHTYTYTCTHYTHTYTPYTYIHTHTQSYAKLKDWWWGNYIQASKAHFLNLGTINIGDQIILCWGICHGCCRVYSRILTSIH